MKQLRRNFPKLSGGAGAMAVAAAAGLLKSRVSLGCAVEQKRL